MKGNARAVKRRGEAPGRLTAIGGLLERDPICGQIVTYLSRHTEAMDTARGIAEWWVNREVRPTEEALLKLLRHGVVRSFIVGSTRVYAYTRNALLRQTLAARLNNHGADGRNR